MHPERRRRRSNHFPRALRLQPDFWEAACNLATAERRRGDLAAAFGPAFETIAVCPNLWLPDGRMRLIHRVLHLDPKGGRYGNGIVAVTLIGFAVGPLRRLLISDLRMGQAPRWVFRHVVAERGNPHWKPIPSEQVRTVFAGRDLGEVWRRLLNP